jgi:hypothetical protein
VFCMNWFPGQNVIPYNKARPVTHIKLTRVGGGATLTWRELGDGWGEDTIYFLKTDYGSLRNEKSPRSLCFPVMLLYKSICNVSWGISRLKWRFSVKGRKNPVSLAEKVRKLSLSSTVASYNLSHNR